MVMCSLVEIHLKFLFSCDLGLISVSQPGCPQYGCAYPDKVLANPCVCLSADPVTPSGCESRRMLGAAPLQDGARVRSRTGGGRQQACEEPAVCQRCHGGRAQCLPSPSGGGARSTECPGRAGRARQFGDFCENEDRRVSRAPGEGRKGGSG